MTGWNFVSTQTVANYGFALFDHTGNRITQAKYWGVYDANSNNMATRLHSQMTITNSFGPFSVPVTADYVYCVLSHDATYRGVNQPGIQVFSLTGGATTGSDSFSLDSLTLFQNDTALGFRLDFNSCCSECDNTKGFYVGTPCTVGADSVCVTQCGDGIVAGSETCDVEAEGCIECVAQPGYQCNTTTCWIPCGDGIVAGNETCDDKNEDPLDGCDQCQTICGDNITVGVETCDLENIHCVDCKAEPGWDCDNVTCVTRCGDDVVAGNETCDVTSDGCVECVEQDGWDCNNITCTPVCGDGVLVGNETCEVVHEGCVGCQEVAGWSCDNTTCVTQCGDGIIVGNETCDLVSDHCTRCQVEDGWECNSTLCVTVCGDGSSLQEGYHSPVTNFCRSAFVNFVRFHVSGSDTLHLSEL
eukprot:TRINITY_DN3710_c0_g1_i7.p1 TRINITY_DN3710_c0_g1~~TRINITY_DN3710_c0_g1_i7.p1  ORF type:complete len:485 (-),score=74.95 TRINITY_DN3710_c0_g1_i7:142-1386(-)